MKQSTSSLRAIWGAVAFAVFACIYILMSNSPTSSQTTLDQFGYLPLVENDPTPTPSATTTVTATSTQVNNCTPPSAISSGSEENEQAILDAINAARDDDNKANLVRVEELVQGARRHSRDMMENNFVANQGSAGDYGPDRILDQCYFLAEDQEIVWGGSFDTATDLINSWLENEFWSRAMLDRDMEDVGAGFIVNNGNGNFDHYITVSFARRLVPATATPTPTNTSTPDGISTKTTVDELSTTTLIAEACALSHEEGEGSGTLISRDPELCTAALEKALRGD